MFEHLKAKPADPILRLMQEFREDSHPQKVDLGVGVYKDEQGHTPLMQAVDRAQRILVESELTKSYIGPPGSPLFNDQITQLVLGNGLATKLKERLAVAQTPGGCGALRMAAEFIKSCQPTARVWVSDPTWANHVPLLGGAGLPLETYPYYDQQTGGVRFDAMMETLKKSARAGDLVLLHGCCHNPSGADLNSKQWQEITEFCLDKGVVPFVDMAYQGLGQGLNEDALGVRYLFNAVPEALLATSCSKNFGLYRERTGALMLLSAKAEQTPATASELFTRIRSHYSMPPAHGASVVETILMNSQLAELWQSELNAMRKRIQTLRLQLNQGLKARGVDRDFSFIERQQGMFSFLGISPEQVNQLRKDFSIYMVESSRINLAGLSAHNLDYVCDGIASILKG
ncbi:aspartate aminotransferase [Marinospirillum celere]|uniref:Aspartate aminotransferase n=1 Tax=Marinospirillum celere TaxID=1122252 RepID=A0A1I1F0V8_9GAMM|nr:amino acid aminotransferase [Marinospirillum celere]SFB90810.1 aspartate aminotransferase [Marinospirillum celere]